MHGQAGCCLELETGGRWMVVIQVHLVGGSLEHNIVVRWGERDGVMQVQIYCMRVYGWEVEVGGWSV